LQGRHCDAGQAGAAGVDLALIIASIAAVTGHENRRGQPRLSLLMPPGGSSHARDAAPGSSPVGAAEAAMLCRVLAGQKLAASAAPTQAQAPAPVSCPPRLEPPDPRPAPAERRLPPPVVDQQPAEQHPAQV